jgi:hypothetical protein
VRWRGVIAVETSDGNQRQETKQQKKGGKGGKEDGEGWKIILSP